MNSMSAFKIPGIYYCEFPDKKDENNIILHGTATIAEYPAYTTWSGLLQVPPDSPYAKRLVDKCGGVPLKKKGKEGWISGFWTAPKDWPEMSAGRESPRPFSSTTHSAKDFPFISVW